MSTLGCKKAIILLIIAVFVGITWFHSFGNYKFKLRPQLQSAPSDASEAAVSVSYTSSVPALADAEFLRRRPVVIWNVDAHPAPSADMRYFVEQLGVKVVHFDLSPPPYCEHFNTCLEQDKRTMMTFDITLPPNSSVQRRFHETFKSDPVVKSVDAFACLVHATVCEQYLAFNRSIIISMAIRYYDAFMKTSLSLWRSWNEILVRLASKKDGRHVIAANNLYDAKLLEYFTGIKPLYIQAYCGYTNATYRPTKAAFLLARRHAYCGSEISLDDLLMSYKLVCRNRKKTTVNQGQEKHCSPLEKIETVFNKSYSYQELASYRGIVHLPYQVSTMSIFEQYRMNIPLFFPSKRLLVEWEIKYHVVSERTIPCWLRKPFTLPPHPSQTNIPNPNEVRDPVAVDYWLQWADWYTLPHIYYYDSITRLVEMLRELTQADLQKTSERMKRYNEKLKIELTEKWKQIALNVAKQRNKTIYE